MREMNPEMERLAREKGLDVEAWKERTDRSADPAFVRHAQVRILPPPWQVVQLSADGGAYTDGRLNVIASVAVEEDGQHWLHVSVTRKDQVLPSYADLCRVKVLFVGSARKAVQVFAPTSQHVNIHPTCLHLFACLEEDRLPDFTGGLGMI